MKKILLVSLLLALLITLTGCDKENSIIGRWGNGSYLYTFNEDDTCSYNVGGTIMKCKYSIDGNKISILFDNTDIPFSTTFKINGGVLIIKDSLGTDVEYIRR